MTEQIAIPFGPKTIARLQELWTSGCETIVSGPWSEPWFRDDLHDGVKLGLLSLDTAAAAVESTSCGFAVECFVLTDAGKAAMGA